MRALLTAGLLAVATGAGAAQDPEAKADDQAPPPGEVKVTQEQLDRMVDAAVARALASRAQASPTPPSPYDPGPTPAPGPSPSAQGAFQGPQAGSQAIYVTQAPQAALTNVLVPPGRLGALLGKCGQKLSAFGQPSVRAYQIAPVEAAQPVAVNYVQAPAVTYVTQATPQQSAPVVVKQLPAVTASAQGYQGTSLLGPTPFSFIKPKR